ALLRPGGSCKRAETSLFRLLEQPRDDPECLCDRRGIDRAPAPPDDTLDLVPQDPVLAANRVLRPSEPSSLSAVPAGHETMDVDSISEHTGGRTAGFIQRDEHSREVGEIAGDMIRELKRFELGDPRGRAF